MLSLLPPPTLSQIYNDGYIATFPIIQRYSDALRRYVPVKEYLIFDLSRIRIRSNSTPWKNAEFRWEYEFDAVVSPDSIPISPFYAETYPGQLLDFRWLPYNTSQFKIFHFLDRLFIIQDLGNFRLQIGRQRIDWGNGRIWRPMDILNPINPLRFDKLEREGVDAIAFQYFPSPLSTVLFVYNPERAFQYQNFFLFSQFPLLSSDCSLLIATVQDQTKIGGGLTGNFFNAAYRFEFLWNTHTDFFQILAGADHQLSSEWYGLIEILYNQPGRTPPSLLYGEFYSPEYYQGSWYSAVLLQWIASLQWSTAFLYMHNWKDRSGMITFSSTFSGSDALQIQGGFQFPIGSDFSEFGILPLSLYLRADFFFHLPPYD